MNLCAGAGTSRSVESGSVALTWATVTTTSRPASGDQFVLEHGDDRAVIASIGATVREYIHRGRHLVRPFGADVVRPAFESALLAPWPNRVIDGRYRWEGVDYQLPLTEPDRGHALHGLVGWLDFARVGGSDSTLELRAHIEPQVPYPFRIRLDVVFELGGAGLLTTVTATNVGSGTAPFGTGPHPYLVAGQGAVDDWTLDLPAHDVQLVSLPRLLPGDVVGVVGTEFDFTTPHAIGDTFIDHCYTGLRRDSAGNATVRVLAADGSGVGMAWGPECAWVQVHTADGSGRSGLAVEPMTCPPGAFNSGQDVNALAPGEATTAAWTIFGIDAD